MTWMGNDWVSKDRLFGGSGPWRPSPPANNQSVQGIGGRISVLPPDLLTLIDEARKARLAQNDADAGARRARDELARMTARLGEKGLTDEEYGGLARQRERLREIADAALVAYQRASYAAFDAETLVKNKFVCLYLR